MYIYISTDLWKYFYANDIQYFGSAVFSLNRIQHTLVKTDSKTTWINGQIIRKPTSSADFNINAGRFQHYFLSKIGPTHTMCKKKPKKKPLGCGSFTKTGIK